ncbi:MAG: hypothetical protein FJX66_01340 [Alphaproteobacteria bacterium]|nr:hypothetical protein [Alphaproteobacteria bacterium]
MAALAETVTRNARPSLGVDQDGALVRSIVRDAARRYAATRRAKVDEFVERQFSLAGALELNRRALGWDLARAPVNIALSGPDLARRVLAKGAGKLGLSDLSRTLADKPLVLETAVARELEYRLFTELLELPYEGDDGRNATRDAFADEVLGDARLELLGRDIPADAMSQARRAIEASVDSYSATRIAAADLASGLVSASIGAVALHKLTPGALSLGPVAAHALIQHAALTTFPLGTTIGGAWYGVFPVSAPVALSIAVTGGIAAGLAVFSALSGVITDPIQNKLGLHRRRLLKLIDAVEAALSGEDKRFSAHDQVVARVFDVVDALTTLRTATKG